MAEDKRATQSDSMTDIKLLNGLDTRLRIAVDFGASFIISGILAIIFKTVFAPMERIKLILQTQASSRQIGVSERSAYSGILNALLEYLRNKECGLYGVEMFSTFVDISQPKQLISPSTICITKSFKKYV